MYCTPSDLVTRFGADELVQLTNRSGLRVPDEAFAQLVAGGDMDAWDEDVQAAAEQMLVAVEEAIEDARAEIDPHLEARRSEERRVGKEWRRRGAPGQEREKIGET